VELAAHRFTRFRTEQCQTEQDWAGKAQRHGDAVGGTQVVASSDRRPAPSCLCGRCLSDATSRADAPSRTEAKYAQRLMAQVTHEPTDTLHCAQPIAFLSGSGRSTCTNRRLQHPGRR